jgi:hypothetical protein
MRKSSVAKLQVFCIDIIYKYTWPDSAQLLLCNPYLLWDAESIREIWKVYHDTSATASGVVLTVDEYALIKERASAWCVFVVAFDASLFMGLVH